MGTFRFSDIVSFDLPDDYCYAIGDSSGLTRIEGMEFTYTFPKERKDKSGIILAERFKNTDELYHPYKFICRVLEYRIPSETVATLKGIGYSGMVDACADNMDKMQGTENCSKVSEGLVVWGRSRGPLQDWDTSQYIGALTCVDDNTMIQLIAGRLEDAPIGSNATVYSFFYEILKDVRINEKKLLPTGYTLEKLRADIEFEEYFIRPFTDESLYPHYNQILKTKERFGALGDTVIVNEGGTEYQFLPLQEMADDVFDDNASDRENAKKALYKKIAGKDTGRKVYCLDQKAKKMKTLFRVKESVFDPKHDRECELDAGYMHRAYMMSALRSFAWVLADYCDRASCLPGNAPIKIVRNIAKAVSLLYGYLSYNDVAYCKGLCTGSDLHVFYVPDTVTKTDQKELIRLNELDEDDPMRHSLMNENDIRCEVHSLDDLRADLEYIYPAVKILWDYLASNRDYYEPLTGDAADIVYAWCALALAAKEPFFTEDGPMTCWFDQPSDNPPDGFSNQKAPLSRRSSSEDKENELFSLDLPKADKSTLSTTEELTSFGNELDILNQQVDELVKNTDSAEGHRLADEMKDMIASGKEDIDKMKRLKEQQAATKKAQEEEAARKKAEAIANGKSEDDSVTMFVILMNEKKLGKLKRSQKDFYETYEEDFPAYSKTALTALRKEISGALEDKALCEYYTECFMKRSVEERFVSSTKNLFSVKEGQDLGDKAKWSIENTKEWYSDSEQDNVQELMDGVLSDIRLQLDSQLETIDKRWTKYATAKEFLQIVISDKKADDSNLNPQSLQFQVVDSAKLVEVKLVSKGSIQMSTTVMDVFPWYWGTTIIDIWENALTDVVLSEKQYASGCSCAYDAFEQVLDKKFNGELVKLAIDRKSCIAKNKYWQNEMTEFSIAEGVEIIEERAFRECLFLENVSFPGSLRTIGENAFKGCKSLRCIVIPEGVVTIGDYAFADCTGIESISLPSTLRGIGKGAFSGCLSLRKVNIAAGVEWLRHSVFYDCKCLESIELPHTIREIDGFAFSGCENLQRIAIPEGVKVIQSFAFYGCRSLTSVELPKSVIVIGSKAFSDCKSLRNIHFNDGLITIHKCAFMGCVNLGNISLPSSLRIIDLMAFCDTGIKSVTLPKNLEICKDAFDTSTEVLRYGEVRKSNNPVERPISIDKSISDSMRSIEESLIEIQKNIKQNIQISQPQSKEGCYIATAVYGDYNAPQVMTLRRFRDYELRKTAFGRWFIRTYYRFSPPVARKLKNAVGINRFVRFLLDKWVNRLEEKENRWL